MSHDHLNPTGADLPCFFGPMDDADGHARVTGPCGDTMEFWIKVDGGVIRQTTFITDGCESSIACGAATAALSEDKTLEQAHDLTQVDVLETLAGLPKDFEHCAILSTNTLKAAIDDFRVRARAQAAKSQEKQRTCEGCTSSSCDAKTQRPGESPQDFAQRQALYRRMCSIKHKILVLSGKGGVGKSTVAVNLAVALMLEGKSVGIMDCDIHGPSIPKMLRLEDVQIRSGKEGILPAELGGLKAMSIGFFLDNRDDAVIWRGPMKNSAIRQFLADVEWGELDYLVIDLPPGTGDEPLSLIQLIEHPDGAVIVTTPQDVSTADVRRSISFCRQLKLPVLGVVENMSGFVCPHCGQVTEIFKTGGGERMAKEMDVPFLGRIPIDPKIGEACDEGLPYIYQFSQTQAGKEFKHIVEPILNMPEIVA